MYHNALIAIDGSEVSDGVLAEATQVVDPKGTITVIEVIDDISHVMEQTAGAGIEVGMALDPSVAKEIVAAQRELADADLAGALKTLEAQGAKHIRTFVCSGLPGPAIVGEAQRRRADIVLMGTHGRGGFKRALLGSVADHVLRHLTDTPLLLVRPSASATAVRASYRSEHMPITAR